MLPAPAVHGPGSGNCKTVGMARSQAERGDSQRDELVAATSTAVHPCSPHAVEVDEPFVLDWQIEPRRAAWR